MTEAKGMRKFLALLKIQLLARFADMKPGNLKKITDKKEKKKLMGTLVAYLVLIVMFAGMIIPYEYFLLEAMAPIGMADLLPALAITLSMVCTLIMSFFFIMTSLYFGKDAAYLAALPIKSSTILSAKLTQVWISETAISALFILPASILYGIRMGVDALFYIRMVLVWLTVSILPICIVTFLSALLIRLSALWKHRETMMTIGGMLFMMLYFVLIFALNTSSMESMESVEGMTQLLTENKDTLHQITALFPPAVWAAKGLLGHWGQMGISLAVNALAVVATVLLLAKPYRKLSLLQTQVPESKKTFKGDKHFTPSTPFMACVKREFRQLTRISTYALNTFPTSVMPVFFVAVMGYALTQEGSAAELKAVMAENGLPQGLWAAVMAAMMCFMAGLNPAVFTAVSREGRNGHGLLTSLPVDSAIYAKAKLTVGMALAVFGLVLAAVVGCVMMPAFIPDMVLALLISILYCYVTNAMALCMDIKNPRLDWMTETESIKQGSSTWKGMLISLGMLLVLAAVSVGLFLLKVNLLVYGLCLMALLGAAAYATHRLLIRTARKYYWVG